MLDVSEGEVAGEDVAGEEGSADLLGASRAVSGC